MERRAYIPFMLLLALIVAAWIGYGARRASAPAPQTMPAYANPATSTARTEIPSANNEDSLEVATPAPNSIVRSPLKIAGQAKGPWYFEGEFPAELLDNSGNIVATGTAIAQGEWTTADFVPFAATLAFVAPTTTPAGLLVFKNDNPSGDPSRDIIFAIPVRFR